MYTDIFFLLKERSIFFANVECVWLPCYSNSPFFIFMILIQSNTGKKNSQARAEDQMLNRLSMKLLDLSSLMALSFCLMLSHSSLIPAFVFQEFPVIPQTFPLTPNSTDFKLRPLSSNCSVPVQLPTSLLLP